MLLFEHGSTGDWAGRLKAQAIHEAGELLILRHEANQQGDLKASETALVAALKSFKPDLLLLLVAPEGSPDAQSLVATAQSLYDGTPVVLVTESNDPRFL